MTDRPLGIADIIKSDVLSVPELPDHWYWCRRHERAEHASEQPATQIGPGANLGCIRIGPFMSEREANILRRDHLSFAEVKEGHVKYERPPAPLGMEVER